MQHGKATEEHGGWIRADRSCQETGVMKKIAKERAAEHLALARATIDRLTLADGPKAYSQAWSDFLSQASRIYSKLEQGAKGCKTSEPWFGRMKAERKLDPLLAYIHHARNSDEHGLDYVVAETGSSLIGTMAEGATEFHMAAEVMLDATGKLHVRNPQTKTPDAVTSVELTEPRMELATVKDRGNNFEPPELHLGRPIVFNSPPAVAKLAVDYLASMLAGAAKLPEHI